MTMNQLSELARDDKPPERIVEIAREYAKTGRVDAAKINAILGDQTKAAIMYNDRARAIRKLKRMVHKQVDRPLRRLYRAFDKVIEAEEIRQGAGGD